MNNSFEKMQKLAFGKVLLKENQNINESDFKNKIREMIKTSLSEKKKSKKDVAPEVEDVEASEEITYTQTDVIEPSQSTGEMDPKVKSVQDHLQSAYENAKGMGDEKLVAQIGNTITYLTRSHILTPSTNVDETEQTSNQ